VEDGETLHTVSNGSSLPAGRAFDRRRLFDTRRRLFLTGLFQDIRVDASTTPAKTAGPWRVRLKERPHKWVKGVWLGVGGAQRLTRSSPTKNLFRRAFKAELTTQWSHICSKTGRTSSRVFLEDAHPLRTSAGWRGENREGYRLERLRRSRFSRELIPS